MIVWGAGSGGSLSVAYRKAGRHGKSFVRDHGFGSDFAVLSPSPLGLSSFACIFFDQDKTNTYLSTTRERQRLH